MSTLINELEKQIRKLIKPLKMEEELIEVLRKRLTKKEYKLLNSIVLQKSELETITLLNLDKGSYDKLCIKLTKKLNQEKLKQELMV